MTKKQELKLYAITRPYCRPSYAWVYAYSREEAIELSNSMFGFVGDTKAKLIKPKHGVFISWTSKLGL